MKAAIYENKNKKKINVIDIEKPELSKNGAIINVQGCGLCGSDIVKLRNGLVKENTVLGHEIVGTIVAVKSNNPNFKVGDKVVGGHHVPCYTCHYCKNENYSMCRHFKNTNIIPGGFAEYIFVSEEHLNNTFFKIPETLSDIEASFVEPTACCLRAIKRANVKIGDNVLILGLGSIGLILGQIAKHFGAFVTGCDLIEERMNLAQKLGFDKTIKYTNLEETTINYINTTNSIGADIVFLASGNTNSLSSAISCARDGGTIIVFSSISSVEKGFTNNEIYYRELTVTGSYSPSPDDLCESLDLLKNSIIKVDSLSKVYPLDKISEAIDDTINNKIIKAYININ